MGSVSGLGRALGSGCVQSRWLSPATPTPGGGAPSGSARPPRPRAEGRRLGTMCFVFLSSGTSVCPFAGELREGRGRPAGTRGGGAVAAARCGAAE